jgi:type I restriction enzyme S subunit
MAGDWTATKWGEIATLAYGKALSGYSKVYGSARVYGTNGPIGWHDEALWDGPGVVVGRKGAYRGVHYTAHPYWVIDTAYSLRPKIDLNLRWAYYQLKYLDVNNIDDGSPIPSTTRDAFYVQDLLLPPREDQDRIASVLSSLDDKIELNRRMAATLEEMARALFKSWFVDFDPVRAKAQGRLTGLPAATAALFPNKFGEGGLPEGWHERPFGEVFYIRNGNTPSTDEARYWGGDHYWATPKDLSRLKSPVLLRTDRTLSADGVAVVSSGLLPVGSLLVSTRAPIGYLAFATCPVAINQGMAGIVGKELSTAFAWLWCAANIDTFFSVAGGSTFPEISKGTLRKLPMVVPNVDVSEAFAACIDPIVARLVELERENDRLATLRDTLLPRLMSGALRIKDGAAQGEAA